MMIWIGRIVAKLRILDQVPDHIDAEAVDTLAKPEAHHVVNRLAHSGVAPVQIGLLDQEGVIVVLPRARIVGPGAAAEFRHPVVRRTTVRSRLAPDVPVALTIIAGTAAFDEPRMLVGGVVGNQIKDKFETARMCGAYERVEILHRAEQWIDAGIIRDVVTKISHRGRKNR